MEDINLFNLEEIKCSLESCREELEYNTYIKTVLKVTEKWFTYVYSSEAISERIIRMEDMMNFFFWLLKDPSISRFYEYYNNNLYKYLSNEIVSLFTDYNNASLSLSVDYLFMAN